jgi:hypothetical protein
MGPWGSSSLGVARWLRGLAGVLLVMALFLGSLLAVVAIGVDTAVAASWTVGDLPTPALPMGELRAVSCPSSRVCVAVGSGPSSASLAEVSTGGVWSTSGSSPAGTVTSLSCASRTFCVGVGSIAGAGGRSMPVIDRWNGSDWNARRVAIRAGRSGSLAGVTCLSRRFCAAVGSTLPARARPLTQGSLIAERWNGSRWRSMTVGERTRGSLTSVSCLSRTSCIAVGGNNSEAIAERWNGARWSIQPVPSDYSVALSSISCPGPSECVAVGVDTLPQSQSIVAFRWNGVRWSPPRTVGGSFGLGVGGLRVSCSSAKSCIFVGTDTTDSNGDTAGFSAHWNGRRWTFLGNSTSSNETLADVSCASRTDCVAVGYGSSPVQGFQLVALAQRWNGSGWLAQSAASQVTIPAVGDALGVSCAGPSACTAVGDSYDGSGASLPLAERWDGGDWTPQSTPVTATPGAWLVAVSCPSPTTCVAVGDSSYSSFAEIWSSGQWTIQDTPTPPGATNTALASVSCTSPTACIAVGNWTNASENAQPLAERFDGSDWSIQNTPTPAGAFSSGLASVSCASASVCTAVGWLENPGVPQQPLAEAWNGSDWTIEKTPTPGSAGALNAISCASASACTAVGWLQIPGAYVQQPLADAWNGSTWTIENAPEPSTSESSTSENGLAGVSCVSAITCTSVGSFGSEPGVETWDGSTWTIQSAPNPSSAGANGLTSVSCPSSGACIAVGRTVGNPGSVPFVETGS